MVNTFGPFCPTLGAPLGRGESRGELTGVRGEGSEQGGGSGLKGAAWGAEGAAASMRPSSFSGFVPNVTLLLESKSYL
jgi:hypothetical protein